MLKKIFKKLFSYNIENNHIILNNKIILVDENGKERKLRFFERIKGLEIHICGRNCVVKIHKPIKKFDNINIEIGNDNVHVEIGSNAHIQNFHVRASFGINQKLILGQGTTIFGGIVVLDEDSQCYIGNNCLIAEGFQIWGSDGHAIFNKDTNELLNRVKRPIIIADNCWFGFACTVLKHTHISSHTVIGSHSLVTGTFNESNIIIAGNPAKIIKRNIDWSGISPLFYEQITQKEKE